MMSKSLISFQTSVGATIQNRRFGTPLRSTGHGGDLQTREHSIGCRRDIITGVACLIGQGIGLKYAVAGETRFWEGQSGDKVVAIKEADQIIANGIVWDGNGHIVSSYITFKDILRKKSDLQAVGRGIRGSLEVVGFDPTLDVIVFRCDDFSIEEPLQLVTKGYRVGSSVISLVRDTESGFFIARGIISGLDRTIIAANGVKMPNLLQTDAPISIMSAGSGLFQPDGSLIGIFTPGNIPFTKFRSDSGVNFIIPGSTLKTTVNTLLKNN